MKKRAAPTLIGGPYHTPRCRVGGKITCERRGPVRVAEITAGERSTDLGAPLAWPRCALPADGLGLILCDDLAQAVRTESNQAVMYYWGISRTLVHRLRRALEVGRFTEGTLARWSEVGKEKLSRRRASKMGKKGGAASARKRSTNQLREGKAGQV